MTDQKTVLVFGTFDFLHIGHLHLLEQAKALGDRLVVCIARDKAVEELKGKAPIHDEKERGRLVRALAMVDDTVPGDEAIGTYGVLDRVRPDIIAVGYDQQAFEDDLRAYLKEHAQNISIERIGAYKPDERKSSMIKQALNI